MNGGCTCPDGYSGHTGPCLVLRVPPRPDLAAPGANGEHWIFASNWDWIDLSTFPKPASRSEGAPGGSPEREMEARLDTEYFRALLRRDEAHAKAVMGTPGDGMKRTYTWDVSPL